MRKIYQQIINRFDGGVAEDKRSTDYSKFSLTKHFDTFTYPHKLVPQLRTKAVSGEDKTKDMVRFVYAPRSGSTYKLFLLGVASGTLTQLGVYMTDGGTASLETPTNNEGSQVNRCEDIFFYYKSYIYMYSNGVNLSRFDVTSSGAFSNTYQTIAYTIGQTQCEPVHHPTDDCAYFFTDNLVLRLNNTSWDGTVLTLPSNETIVAATDYGNFLAIGTITKGTFAVKSKVYLWDRDSSLATISAMINLGDGVLGHLAVLDDRLIAVISGYSNSTFSNKRSRLSIRQIIGSSYVTLNEITTDSLGTMGLPNTRVIRNNKLYFPAEASLRGDARRGIWAVDSRGRMTIEVVEEEVDSAASQTYQGIYLLGEQWWFAHSNDGSVNRTIIYDDSNDTPNYSTTLSSSYESLIMNGGDSSATKKLLSVTVMTEPMPTAGQIVLKYRLNEESSWTTIFTHTTDNSISHTAINIESTGVTLPEYKEIQFQINSTGGAVVTGLKVKYELMDSDIIT